MDLSGVTRAGVVVPVRPDRAGVEGPTPWQARGPEWRRSSHGLYVPAYVDSDEPDQRIVEAAALLPAGRAAVTGWASLHWRGARWFGGRAPDGVSARPVPLAVDGRHRLRTRPGVRVIEDWLEPIDIERVDGLPLTSAVRAVTTEVRRARHLAAAVTVVDMAAFDDLIALDELTADAEHHLVARPWARKVIAAIGQADENAWSPREVGMRLLWQEAVGVRPLCNRPVFDTRGQHLFTPDLLDAEAGVVGEYDGLIHLEDGRRSRDLTREELIRDHGLELVTMVSADSADREAFSRRVQAAYRRARVRGLTGSWTITQPPWWIDTSTVALRRTLSAEQRARLLKRQAA